MAEMNFGGCCACGKKKDDVRNVICLPKKAPVAGAGWGCVVCGLEADGAIAMVCDDCLENQVKVRWAVAGYADGGGRVEVGKLKGTFEHNMFFHEPPKLRAKLGKKLFKGVN